MASAHGHLSQARCHSFACQYYMAVGQLFRAVTGIPVGTTFLALFDQLRAGALEAFAGHAPVLQRLGLSQSFVGSAKDSLVHVDYHLPIDDDCRQFGSYVRLITEEEETVSRKSLIKLNNEVMNNNCPPAPKSRKWLMRNNKSSLSGLIVQLNFCVADF